MAELKVNIPPPQLTRVLNGFSYQHGYQDQIDDPANPGTLIPNPQTKSEFTKDKLKEFVKESVKAYEGSNAGKAARQAAIKNAESNINLT